MDKRTGVEYAVNPGIGKENRTTSHLGPIPYAEHPDTTAVRRWVSARNEVFMRAKFKAYGVEFDAASPDFPALTAKATRERPMPVKVKMPSGQIIAFPFEEAVEAIMVGKGELL
jgi:hypothetical protein